MHNDLYWQAAQRQRWKAGWLAKGYEETLEDDGNVPYPLGITGVWKLIKLYILMCAVYYLEITAQ